MSEYFETRVRARGQVTLPVELRRELGIDEGDNLIVRTEGGRIIIEQAQVVPADRVISEDQAWFWTQRWQQMERTVQADIDSGRVRRFSNADELEDEMEKRYAGDRDP